MDWTEFSIAIDHQAVEAVANFIHESGAGGVVIEKKDSNTSNVTAYYPAGEEAQAFLSKLEEFLSCLEDMNLTAKSFVSIKNVPEQDWAEEWKKHCRPVDIGNIHIYPSWLEPSAAPGKVAIELDPGMAFGTGDHATTKMCVGEIASRAPGKRVLDLGSGSGILSIVAAKTGATRVDAVDNDPVAVKVAQENAQINKCNVHQLLGDAFAEFANSDHDLVVANIGYNACSRLADIFRQGKDCTLILSGFPQERLAEFEGAYGGLIARCQIQEGWVCVTLEAQ
jgi:ribosomal protein L11 methyltransferase